MRIGHVIPMLLLFLSGCAGLVYQVLWMRQLGLLFGNTSHAAAVTLAVFFGGLAAGSWFWGRRVSMAGPGEGGEARPGVHPLRVYGWLEVGIGCAALLYFGILPLFHRMYPALYRGVGPGPVLLLVKCVLAIGLVFPPAFFMGGTLPAMGQFLISRRERFGATTARLYGVNTIGAALGTLMAAFVLIPRLGFRATCFSAMGLTGIVAAVAFRLSRGPWKRAAALAGEGAETAAAAAADQPIVSSGVGRQTIFCLAFLSGFSVLALEVLWTRMLAQIHENSVYSFATVLMIVLICLAAGALLAGRLARLRVSSRQSLAVLTIAAGVVLSFVPLLFVKATGGFTMLDTGGSFAGYVLRLFGLGFLTVGPACLLLAVVFPFLMKSEERYVRQPGHSIGSLSAINTVGAILGSLACGFLLLGELGMWWTVQAFAAVYLVAGMALAVRSRRSGLVLTGVGAVFLVLLVTALNPADLPVLGTDPNRRPRRVLEVWETSDCSVAVVEDKYGGRTITVNSNYRLGSIDAVPLQVFQGRIPLFAFPATESVFFLGMGTGITAGSALDADLFPAVKRVIACELVPEVVTAAKRYMAGGFGGEDYTNGLFVDPRAEILVEDGRHYLMATDSRFDMINADLFLPYRSGAGSLYSREHFESAKARLNPGGVFVQWLPLYQVTEFEFGTICRTLLGVFDQVTMWRNNFVPGSEVVALVGHRNDTPLAACDLDTSRDKLMTVYGRDWRHLPDLLFPCDRQTVALFYCGNLSVGQELFDTYPINTDDRPVIEYTTPRSLRGEKTEEGMPPTFVGPRLADLVDRLLEICPPEMDPVLADRTPENRRLPLAGAALHRAWIGYALSDPEACREAWEVFVREWTNQ